MENVRYSALSVVTDRTTAFSPDTVDRLRPLYIRAQELGPSVLGAARLSENPRRYQFSVLRKVLQVTPLEMLETSQKKVYRDWLRLPTEVALHRGEERNRVSQPTREWLIEQSDPAVFAIHCIEKIRLSDFPDLEKERNRLITLSDSYDYLLRSIHGSQRARTDGTIEVHTLQQAS